MRNIKNKMILRNFFIHKMVRIGVAMIGIMLWASLVSNGIINGKERPMITKDSAPSVDDTLSKTLCVAAVQMRSSDNLSDNVTRIKGFIKDYAAKGIRVAAFPV